MLDRRGKVVAKATGPSDLRVRHPHLWSIEDPYLYTLRTELSVRGKVVDTTSTRFGIRWFRIDANEGFFLNGRYHKIQGVDLHHDLGALGAAVNRDAIERQMRLMKSMGVNAFRTSHNPPSPEMIEVCEELGIVMMVEAFDTWRTPKRQFDYGRFFDANSDADIKEMVNAAKNSPAVILWSIGNEVPDSTSVSVGLPIARQLIADIKSIDDTRPIVIGSDKYRSVPSPDSGADQILRLLDGLGLNYNTAQSVDALHARYPDKFLFESESSSETSSRGAYQDPHLLNTGENYTPGKRAASSYDNNLASWTMSSEYGLKKDRDRKYFLGEFLWSGIDYIGEPTPYNVFPVKASFFGAMDTAGFPKDAYYIFRSQWTKEPMVHLTPMNWTDHEPGQDVEVWAYANVDTVELFLNGESLGVRRYDHKVTTFGKEYLETTEPTGDDKTFPSGSYTSPNGSTGKLHLTWHVPFAPGRLVAVARKDGAEVARDVLKTAGEPDTLRLTPDREVVRADGRSLAFVTVDVVDKHGAFVPGADNRISFDVSGGTLVGLDNGRQESAENYKATARRAFNGKALAIVQSDDDAGPITVKATSPGLLPATTTVHATDATGKKLIGFDAVAVRAAVGDKPALPATVEGAYADGSTKALPVTWDRVPEEAGRHTVSGDVKGTSLDAEATVSVYEVGGIESWSTVVPAGIAAEVAGHGAARVHRRRRTPGARRLGRDRPVAVRGRRAVRGARHGRGHVAPGAREHPRDRGRRARGEHRTRSEPAAAERRRELLRRADQRSGGAARRDDCDRRLVELLQQGGDRAAAGRQQRARERLGVGALAEPADLRDDGRVLHDVNLARAAVGGRGDVLGREPVGAGLEPRRHVGDGVQPADHDHVRPGRHDGGPARDDQPAAEHEHRLPAARRAAGDRRRGRVQRDRRARRPARER